MKRYKAFLFDWDGTLATTLDTWLRIIRDNYHKYGLYPEDRVITDNFGNWRAAEKLGLNPKQVDAFVADLRAVAHVEIHDAPLYPHTKQTLEALRAKGVKTALVTSSMRETIDAVLEHHDLVALFDIVVTGNDVAEHKPHPESLEYALKELEISVNDAVMIGDSDKDLEAAKNAGVDSILFYPESHHTFHDKQKLLKFKPVEVIEDLAQLARH